MHVCEMIVGSLPFQLNSPYGDKSLETNKSSLLNSSQRATRHNSKINKVLFSCLSRKQLFIPRRMQACMCNNKEKKSCSYMYNVGCGVLEEQWFRGISLKVHWLTQWKSNFVAFMVLLYCCISSADRHSLRTSQVYYHWRVCKTGWID